MTLTEIQAEIQAIKNETAPGAITPDRLGTLLDEMIDHIVSGVQSGPYVVGTGQSASYMSNIASGSTVMVPPGAAYTLPGLNLNGTIQIEGMLTIN